MKSVKQFILILLVLLVFDSIYLFAIGNFVQKIILSVQKSPLKLNLYYAAIVYLIMGFSIYHFGFVRKVNLTDLFLIGFLGYAIYDFTNLATLKNWNVLLSLIDPFWGGTLFVLTYIITKSILN